MDELWDEIKYWYDTLGIPNRLNSLRLTMFVNPGDFPELSARAAETRSLVPVMAHVCAARNNGSERDGHRLIVFEALARFYELIEGRGLFLTTAVVNELQTQIDRFLKHSKWLTLDAIRRHKVRWPLVTKHHFYGTLVRMLSI